MLWNKKLYYFTLDAGKVRYCQEGDASWQIAGGTNTFTTNAGGRPKFIRALNSILVLNGDNGDKLAYVDMTKAGFPVVKYVKVADPTTALTFARNNLETGPFHVYYSYTYSGAFGQTNLAPIVDVPVAFVRDQWNTNNRSVKLSRPAGDAPQGATYWNLFISIAATSGAIKNADMLTLVVKLDLNSKDFVDDGSLDINLGSTPPDANSTDGPRVADGIVENGNPILYRDKDNGYNVWIGGGGPNALDFSISNGGYRAEPENGTNYYPISIIGFRTGTGSPALTILYSNTEGLSKQSILEQQTISYGDQSFTVWGVTDQHYGAAGVAAPNSGVNYNGKLMFLSTDGFLSAQTDQGLQNVLSFVPTSSPIDKYVRSIKNAAMPTVVGTGWNNKYLWTVPSLGFDTPREILVLDTNNKGVEGNGAWYALNVPADWIGVVSPQSAAAFVYVSQGKRTFKLLDLDTTYDTIDGVNVPFSTGATGGFRGNGGAAHNSWLADVQAVFDVVDIVGSITVGVRYKNQSQKVKFKEKTFVGPTFTPSVVGGYGDTQWTYAGFKQVPGYRTTPKIDKVTQVVTTVDKRIFVRIDEIHNEAQWYFRTDPGYNNYRVMPIAYEGVNLGVRADLQ